MPRRNYQIFKWKDGEKINDRCDDVRHNAKIHLLGVAENNDDQSVIYLIEIDDDMNLDNPVLFTVVSNTGGKITELKSYPHLRKFQNIKFDVTKDLDNIEIRVILVMGDDLGETLYKLAIDDKHRTLLTKFELRVSAEGEITYTQEDTK